MTAIIDRMTEVQDQIVDVVGQVQEPVTNIVKSVVEFVTEKLPEIPVLPFADRIPTPTELVDVNFEFAGKLLDANKELAAGIASAVAPLTNKALDRKVKAVRSAKTTKVTKAA